MTEQLTLLTWPDYINPATLAQFESEFGARVNLEIVPSAVELIERMTSDGPAPDVLCPPDYAVRELGALGRLAALDHARLSNFAASRQKSAQDFISSRMMSVRIMKPVVPQSLIMLT